MPDIHSHQNIAPFDESHDSRAPANRAMREGSVAPERPSQRVLIQQYLEALRQGVTLSS
jgi:hypothetical protein